jgi:hypothetical protein
MTTTIPPTSPVTASWEYQTSATPAHASEGDVLPMDAIVLESCHCTWIFDPDRLQFCRILKGIEVAGRSVCTAWRPYWQLELDPEAEGFTVYLNASRTRLIRSWRHTQNCAQCGGREATEFSLEDIQRVVHVRRAIVPSPRRMLAGQATVERRSRRVGSAAQTKVETEVNDRTDNTECADQSEFARACSAQPDATDRCSIRRVKSAKGTPR